MSVIITFMFEPAKLQMNWARARGASIARKALDGRPADALSVTIPTRFRAPRRADGSLRDCPTQQTATNHPVRVSLSDCSPNADNSFKGFDGRSDADAAVGQDIGAQATAVDQAPQHALSREPLEV
jgi:hypothetical protein